MSSPFSKQHNITGGEEKECEELINDLEQFNKQIESRGDLSLDELNEKQRLYILKYYKDNPEEKEWNLINKLKKQEIYNRIILTNWYKLHCHKLYKFDKKKEAIEEREFNLQLYENLLKEETDKTELMSCNSSFINIWKNKILNTKQFQFYNKYFKKAFTIDLGEMEQVKSSFNLDFCSIIAGRSSFPIDIFVVCSEKSI